MENGSAQNLSISCLNYNVQLVQRLFSKGCQPVYLLFHKGLMIDLLYCVGIIEIRWEYIYFLKYFLYNTWDEDVCCWGPKWWIYSVAVTERDFYSVFLIAVFVLTDEMLVLAIEIKLWPYCVSLLLFNFIILLCTVLLLFLSSGFYLVFSNRFVFHWCILFDYCGVIQNSFTEIVMVAVYLNILNILSNVQALRLKSCITFSVKTLRNDESCKPVRQVK